MSGMKSIAVTSPQNLILRNNRIAGLDLDDEEPYWTRRRLSQIAALHSEEGDPCDRRRKDYSWPCDTRRIANRDADAVSRGL